MSRRPSLVLALLLGAALVVPARASAAVTCAPDAYETDTMATPSPVAVAGTLTRAICQERNPPPRTSAAIDYDYFSFRATGGKAYTGEVVARGSALASSFNMGGLYRYNADGSTTSMPVDQARDGTTFRTEILPAGTYGFLAYSSANQVYPDNTLDMATIQGDAGSYTVTVKESAPAVTVASLSISPARIKGGDNKPATATFTLSAPAPSGGMYLFNDSSSRFVANPEVVPYVAAGATRGTFVINAPRRVSSDTVVTISLSAYTGPTRTAVLTVQR